MPRRQLVKSEWRPFFRRLEPLLRANVVEVEASGLGVKDKVAADWVRLVEVAYDGAADELQISAYGGERAIRHPAEVHVRQEEGWLQSIEIVDGEGNRDFVILKQPLRLAPP